MVRESSDVQQLWLTLLRRPWRSIAVVPTDSHASARSVTASLLELSVLHDLEALRVFEGAGLALPQTVHLREEIAAAVTAGTRAVVGLGSFSTALEGVAVARATDAVLLVLRLGASTLGGVRETIEIVGRERVVGTVVLDGSVACEPFPADVAAPAAARAR
jgi:hypothetical protein